jgi:hypothetical protein
MPALAAGRVRLRLPPQAAGDVACLSLRQAKRQVVGRTAG